MNEVRQTIEKAGLVPVIQIDAAEHAVPLAQTLSKGGLPIAEITFRTDAAADALAAVGAEVPDVLLGAGTVLSVEQAQTALDAGAKFIVAPGFNPRVVDFCLERGVPVTPGVNSPTDIEMGLERGLTLLKFFPAEASGGVKMVKALSAPYREVRFIPTGGIKPDNLGEYLGLPSVVACGGSWMVPKDALAGGAFDRIEQLVREAVKLAQTVRAK
jgi:2-dehydro-3-deoxyphosphogluconate aldolase/(4S)-4-hydroxy-2-oxoglutarate aldolase